MKAIALLSLMLTASSALASVDPVAEDPASLRPIHKAETTMMPITCIDGSDPQYLMIFARSEEGRARLVGVLVVQQHC